MAEENLQEQINQLNNKMDILLEYVQRQNSRSETIDDFISDVAIIGKDIYDSSVEVLDTYKIEINPEEIRQLILKLLRNVKNFNVMLDTVENITDFMKDATPIANELLIDFSKKLHEMESKGYFELLKGLGKLIDTAVTNYSKEDQKNFTENLPVILSIIKQITDKNVLSLINNILYEYNNMDTAQMKKYSWWKLSREIRSPQMKQSMGILLNLVKNVSNNKN